MEWDLVFVEDKDTAKRGLCLCDMKNFVKE